MNESCKFLHLLAKYFVVLYLLIQGRVQCDGGLNTRCIDREVDALLKFQGGLKDHSNRLSSWQREQNCCQWKGVGCSKTTGHVISINLSYTNIGGTIPNHLGNLSKLKCLDLSGSKNSLSVNNLNWLSGLSSLQELDMSEVDLTNAKNWFDVINTLSSLVMLRLSTCRLHTLPLRLVHVNITSLIILDLSSNAFNATVPQWLFEIGPTLRCLNLSTTKLYGPIPGKFENLQSLAVLDLSNNNLNGPIPSSLGQTQSKGGWHTLIFEGIASFKESFEWETRRKSFAILRVGCVGSC
ncbi:hypothetical protein RIF29_03485 [Crotalaria pallida]|uniref:Leucine-rich repeat-containing N-terminal plant-type domain-containing protein n=1 Tax=Crotalaria pallida TaxID=3830 RepID=A0AAN9P9H0_CROPI